MLKLPSSKASQPRSALCRAAWHAVTARHCACALATVAAMGFAALGLPSAQAGNDAYSPDATSGLFSNSFTLNTTTPTAGGTSSPASGDALYFGTVTTGTTTVTNDLTNFTFAGFTFNAGASAFTIGGNAFTLSGAITNNSTSTETINNNITLAATEAINANLGNVNLGGAIGDGGGGFGLTKNGTGTLTLSGASTYTGTTTVNAGTLNLTGSLASTTLALGGGTFNYAPTAAGTKTFSGGTTFNAGGSGVGTATGSTLALGTITRNTGGNALFNLSTGGTISGTAGTGAALLNGVLPWGVVLTNTTAAAANSANGYTFATLSGGNVVAYTGATAAAAFNNIPSPTTTSTVNYDVGAVAAVLGNSRAANTIRYYGAAGTQALGNTNTIFLTTSALLNAGTGTLTISQNTAASGVVAGSSELVLAAANAGITISAPIYNTGTTTTGAANNVTNGTTATSLTITGPNTVTLSGTNLYTGTTYIDSGTLSVATNANLGATTAPVALNGGTLTTTAGITDTHAITVGAAGGTISVTTTGQLYLHTANTLLGSGPLTLTGTGSLGASIGNLRVDVANTYSGNLTATSGGIFEYGATGAVGSAATFTVGNQGEVAVQGTTAVALPNSVLINGGTNSVLSFENGNLGVFSGPITANANLTVGLRDWYAYANARSGTISGVISGIGGLTLTSGTSTTLGTLTLSGANTYTGATSLGGATGGNLIIDHSGTNTGALGNTAVTVGPNTLTVKGTTAIGNTSAATLNVGNGTTGTLSLQDTTINTLTVGGALTLNTAALNFDIGGNGATGTADQINTGGVASITGTNTINLNLLAGQTVTSGNYTLLTATGGLGTGFVIGAKPAGFNTYSLANSTTTAEILSVTATPAANTEYWTGRSSVANGDTAPYKWGYGSNLATPASNWSTNLAGTTDALQVPLSNTDTYFTATNAAPTSGTTLATQLDGAYGIKGLFFDTSANANGINVVTVDTNGNTLTIGADGLTSLAANTSAVTISGTGSVVLNGTQAWANNSAQTLTISSGITGNATTGTNTLTFNGTGSGAVVLSGVIGNGANGGLLGLTFSRANGTLTLSGANTYTGGTTITSGTVFTGAAGALPAAGALTLSGGTLDISGVSPTVASLSDGGTSAGILTNSSATAGTFTVNGTASTTYSGTISGGTAFTLAKNGTGTLTLSGNNNYGNTSLVGGIINAQSNNAFGTSGTVFQSNGVNGRVDGIQLQGGITIPSGVSFQTSNDGTGTVPYAIDNVSGNNTLNGTITLVAGGGGSVIQSDSGALTLAGNISIATGQTSRGIILQGASTAANTVSGVVSDLSATAVNSVTKTGTGTWTLSAANTYTGATSVTGGALNITGTLGNTAVGVSAGTLGLGNANAISQNVLTISGTGNLSETVDNAIGGTAALVIQNSNVTLSRPNAYSGDTTINAGTSTTLTITNAAGAGTSRLAAATGATTPVFNLHIDGGGTIAMANSFGGNSGVTATIDVNNNGGAGTNGLIQLNGTGLYGNATLNVTGGNGYNLAIAGFSNNAGSAGTAVLNPTTANLTIGTYTSTTNFAKTLQLDGTSTGNAVTGVISNGAAGTVAVTKTNTSTWTLGGANTYTGNTTVSAGILTLTGSINGSPAVSVANGGTLTLGNATALSDAGTLSLVSGATFRLNGAGGTSETISSLILDGTTEPNGVYTAAQLTALDPAITFSSLSGETLTVFAVPEPSTWATMLGGLAGLVGWTIRRKRRA